MSIHEFTLIYSKLIRVFPSKVLEKLHLGLANPQKVCFVRGQHIVTFASETCVEQSPAFFSVVAACGLARPSCLSRLYKPYTSVAVSMKCLVDKNAGVAYCECINV